MMERFKNGLVVYTFYTCADKSLWDCPISAIVNEKETTEETAIQVFNAMGFKTVDEYADNYPGGFMPYSGILETIDKDGSRISKSEKHKWRRNVNFSEMWYYDHADEYKIIEHINGCHGEVELFTTVTMDQYKQSVLYERRNHGLLDDGPIRYEWLWFCLDWVEIWQ